MDSAVVPNANQTLVEQRLLYAVKAIRSINMLAHVPILIAAEAKFGPTGGTVMYMFDILKKHYGENIGEIHIMCESGPHRNPGVPKDPKRTQEMVNLSRRQMRFDRVYFSRHLKVGLSNDQTVEGNKDKLFDQMRKFILKKITKDGSTADIRWKWEGEEGHDDMMITFLMGTFSKGRTVTNSNVRNLLGGPILAQQLPTLRCLAQQDWRTLIEREKGYVLALSEAYKKLCSLCGCLQ